MKNRLETIVSEIKDIAHEILTSGRADDAWAYRLEDLAAELEDIADHTCIGS